MPTGKLSLLLVTSLLAGTVSGAGPGNKPRSGYEFLSPETRDMQEDEFSNPGFQTVDEGAELFITAGENGKSCASCHGDRGQKLKPRNIASYPVYSEQLEKPLTLQGQIHRCWTERLGKPAMKYDNKDAIRLETFVRNLAEGRRIDVETGGPMRPYYEAGREFFYKPTGQLDMACAHCHEQYVGARLRAQVLTQGQSNGFPTYRLANNRVNSLHERFRQCQNLLRAQFQKAGSDDYINLEVFMHARSNGLRIETPAIRF
jgi:sulfur-oxidizing protein SoxA